MEDFANDRKLKKSNSQINLKSSLLMKNLEDVEVSEFGVDRYEKIISGVTVSAQGKSLVYVNSTENPS